MIPDISRIVGDYLRDLDIEGHVRTTPPDDTDEAWVQITLINAPQDPRSPVDHLVAFNLQFDCYAGEENGPPESNDLALAVRAALVIMDEQEFDDAVVTAVRIGSDFELRDTDFKPARDRRILTATIHAHALEAVS